MKKQLLLLITALLLSWSAGAQMVLEFNTSLSDGTSITLPLKGTVDVTVDWGDGNSNTFTAEGLQEHTYAAEGTYTVSITGSLTQFGASFPNAPNIDKLVKVTSFGDIGLTSLNSAFSGAINLEQLPAQLPSSVRNLRRMFFAASNFNFNISSWDVSQVTDMAYMFCAATKFNQDIGGWNMSNVINMSTMFSGAKAFNQDISGWDVSKVTDMSGMFETAAAFNQNIGAWDVSSVTAMQRMFSNATAFNQNIGAWDVSSVTTMERMFMGTAAFNQDIGSWDVSSVTTMRNMFTSAIIFNQDISTWDVSSVTNMNGMFYQALAFNQNISTWNVSKVTDMREMFRFASSFDQDISTWDVSSVTIMMQMFEGVTLSTANYNKLLIGWAGQTVKSGVTFNGGNSMYSPGEAAAARAVLVGTYAWSIIDGGEVNTLGVTFNETDKIKVYPNPFSNEITIINADKVKYVTITNTIGQCVMSITLTGGMQTINLSELNSGVYLAAFDDINGERIVRKMIKK